jgi:Protein of unknown function (DUF3833)
MKRSRTGRAPNRDPKRSIGMRLLPLCLVPLMTLSACMAASDHARLEAPEPIFSPETFFAGRTEGRGVLNSVMGRPRQIAVHGVGRVAPDGTITLDQSVEQEGKPPRQRRWILRRAGADRFVGTLTGARGPVVAQVRGNRMHIRFEMNDGLIAEQWIYLQPGGQSALNRMSITKFGMLVATLDETVRREP